MTKKFVAKGALGKTYCKIEDGTASVQTVYPDGNPGGVHSFDEWGPEWNVDRWMSDRVPVEIEEFPEAIDL